MGRTNFDTVKASTMGSYTVVTADDTAGTKTISLASYFGPGETAVGMIVQILRAGVDVTADAVISLSSNNLVVADGGATYALTAGDVINYIVY